jgi:spermidine synthase
VTDEPRVLERAATPRGELVLRQVGDDLEVISNGVFLMDTRDGGSERALVHEAVADHQHPQRLLIGGLGVGFSLLEALDQPGVV